MKLLEMNYSRPGFNDARGWYHATSRRLMNTDFVGDQNSIQACEWSTEWLDSTEPSQWYTKRESVQACEWP